MSYIPPYRNSKNKIEVELDLSNYATKSDLKNPTGVDTSQFAKKDDLANLKSAVDKLDIDKLTELDADKLKPVPAALKNQVMQSIKKLLKKTYTMIQSKILKKKYLILLS